MLHLLLVKTNQAGFITLQELSRRSGVGASALNYYTNIGLLRVADRRGNRRFYRESESIRRLHEIRRLRQEGYPLRIIRKQLQEAGKA